MNLKYALVIPLIGAALTLNAGIHEEPDGVAIEIDDAGGYRIISIGTGTYDFNDQDDILDARNEAERNAKAAISKFLKESMATESSATAQTGKVKKLSSNGTSSSKSVSKTVAKETINKIRSASSSLLSGVIVLEDEKVPSGDEGGKYRVMVGVSSKTIAAATSISNSMSASVAAQDGYVPSATVEAPEAESSAGLAEEVVAANGLPPLPEGWVMCVGVGEDHKQAVQEALVEGVGQVYGQLISQEERYTERMNKLKVLGNVLGKGFSAAMTSKSKDAERATLTKTAGFVREFRVISCEPADGGYKAIVYAFIVNPRAGGTQAVLVKAPTMRVETRTKSYQLGPNVRMSGAQVGKTVLSSLPQGLANANKFVVITDKSLVSLIENKALTDTMAENGLANGSEAMLAGQGLTPDYTLSTEILDIKYTKKLDQDKKTKKFGQVYKMTIKMDVSLVNARQGGVVKASTLTINLDNDEIKALLEEDEEADLFQAALGKLALEIEEWIK